MANSQRQRIEKKRHQNQRQQTVLVAIISILVIGLIGVIVVQAGKADDHSDLATNTDGGIGEKIPVETADHVQDGLPVNSPSDPPTSGTHYGVSMPSGFYGPDSPEFLNPTHDGYLIHSLEHGYIIFWYNCDLLDAQSCSTLKEDIQLVMDEFNGVKLIAFPRPSLDVPLVMTSWGYLQKFENFNHDLAVQFIVTNQPLAPEPGGV
jgi:hypothetical protein